MVESTASSGSTGAGQQFPDDASSEFQVIAFIVQQMMARLDTMKPVKVVAVHDGAGAVGPAGTVDVQPLVNQIDGSGNSTPHGTVNGIPWFRFQGGKNAIIMDPLVGDIGFVVCSDRDMSAVKSSKAAANPGSRRKFNVADGVYVGGILNDAPEQYVRFTEDMIEAHDKTGNVVKLSSAGIELTPSGVLPVKINGNAIVTGNLLLGGNILAQAGTRYAGNLDTSGDVIAGTVHLKTHTHTQANDSHGDVEGAISVPVP